MSTNFHYDLTIIEEEKFVSTVITISRDDTMSAEKSLSWNVLVFQLLNKPAPTVSKLRGSCWYQKKQNDVLFRSHVRFFFHF